MKWEVGEIADIKIVASGFDAALLPVKVIHVAKDCVTVIVIANDFIHHLVMRDLKLAGHQGATVEGRFHPETGDRLGTENTYLPVKLIKRT